MVTNGKHGFLRKQWLPILRHHPYILLKVKVKINSSLCLTNYALRHEGVWGECMYRSTFFYLGTSWRWVFSFTPLQLYPRGKSHRYSLYRRFGGPQNRSGRYGEVKILDPTWTQTPTPRFVQPVASRYTDYAIRPKKRSNTPRRVTGDLAELRTGCFRNTYVYIELLDEECWKYMGLPDQRSSDELVTSNGNKRAGVSHPLTRGRKHPVSETLWSLVFFGIPDDG
jgi:hypothetical protein